MICKDANVNDFYIGHTTNLKKRYKGHCDEIERERSHKRLLYVCIKKNGDIQNWDIVELEQLEGDLTEAKNRERFYIESLCPTLNKEIPNRTRKEWQKQNYNKEKNTEKMREYRKIKITCECGAIFSKPEKARHEKTKWHKKYLELTSGHQCIS